MKKAAKQEDRLMSIKEVAEATGASYSTVAAYAQKAGWTNNGKRTRLTEEQAAIILEAMKRGNSNQHDLLSSLVRYKYVKIPCIAY
jgi:transposase